MSKNKRANILIIIALSLMISGCTTNKEGTEVVKDENNIKQENTIIKTSNAKVNNEKETDVKQKQANMDNIEPKQKEIVEINTVKAIEEVEEKELSKLSINDEDINLIYNGDVVLQYKDYTVVIDKGVDNDELFGENYGFPNSKYSLKLINNTKSVAVIKHTPFMKCINVSVDIFNIEDKRLNKIWTTDNSKAKLLNANKDRVVYSSTLAEENIDYKLTEEEGTEVIEKLKRVKPNSDIESETDYWKRIEENLIEEITECSFIDIDNDGKEEMLLSIWYHTLGASTPIRLRVKAIMVFDIGSNMKFKEIIFERENKNKELKEYFIGEI